VSMPFAVFRTLLIMAIWDWRSNVHQFL
jgi:hypothetical protein